MTPDPHSNPVKVSIYEMDASPHRLKAAHASNKITQPSKSSKQKNDPMNLPNAAILSTHTFIDDECQLCGLRRDFIAESRIDCNEKVRAEYQQILNPPPPRAAPTNGDIRDIHAAIVNGNLEKLKLLLEEHPSLVSARDDSGWLPLHRAAQQCKGSADLLILAGADVNAETTDSRTPLYIAAFAGLSDVVELLLANGAWVNYAARRSWGGGTPLGAAASQDKVEVARVLIAHGATVDAKDDRERTPLHNAAFIGSAAVAALLLDFNANVEARDCDGLTPMHLAVWQDRVPVVKLLIANHADVNAPNNNGGTPLGRAIAFNRSQIAALLQQAGAWSA